MQRFNDLTLDSIWSDELKIAQPKQGYRFGIDSVLLAHFVSAKSHRQALEIGAGSGIVSILAATLQPGLRITAVEVQPELALLCLRNAQQNSMTQIEVLQSDARELAEPLGSRGFDLIFSNPPYRKAGAGKLNPVPQKAIARHEIKFRLEDLFEIASERLHAPGELCVVLPDFRYADFQTLAQKYEFSWMRRQWVKSFRQQQPVFFLASVCKKVAEFEQLPELIVYESPGVYTEAVAKMLRRK